MRRKKTKGEKTAEETTTAIERRRSKSTTSAVDQACVVVIHGPELGRRASVTREPFEIGRASTSHLSIEQESVSRHHARITWNGSSHMIEDLGSTNGTLVNDQPVKAGPVKDGDQIGIGRAILKFMAGDNVETSYHEAIYRLMTIDALTETHNRRSFDDLLEREYKRSRRYRRHLSLLLFDIDHFKKINDTFGHIAGDVVLRQLAALVRRRLRAQDVLARVGGEEFCVLLPEVEIDAARIVAEQLRQMIEHARFRVDNRELSATISCGVVQVDHRVATPDLLYALADKALYEAKNGGRNRISG